MKCPTCTKVLRQDWNYCPHCGYRKGSELAYEERQYMQDRWGLTTIELNALTRVCYLDRFRAYRATEQELIDARRVQSGAQGQGIGVTIARNIKNKMKGKPPK